MFRLPRTSQSTLTNIWKHYNHLANQNKIANATAYRQWIESHPPAVIREANLARRHLKKLGGNAKQLQDQRQVRFKRTSYTYFYQQRLKSGDFRGLKMTEAAKLVGREWKGLQASEKKVCRCKLRAGAGVNVP